MSTMRQNFYDEYASALRRYLVQPEEAILQKGYVLGRKALAEKISLVEMVSLHQEAVANSLARRLTAAKRRSLTQAADEFFRECVGPFEMTLRGFQESLAELQQMNTILEKRVMERTEAMKRSTERLQALFQASPLAVIEIDSGGHVLMWNPAAERLFGWTQEEVLGVPNPIIPAEQQKDSLLLRERALRGERFAMLETTRQRKDGTLISVSFSLAPLYDSEGKASGIVTVIADITERKRAEEGLRRARDELEFRVRERTFELVSANKALEEEIIERKQIEERLRYLSTRLLEVQETERRNVALDLHDSIGSSLAGIKMAMEFKLKSMQEGKAFSESTTVEEILTMVKKCIAENKRIQHNLRPSTLDLLGLAPAIRSLCRNFETTYHMETKSNLEIDELRVPEKLKIVIYRISQEALNNAAKHSRGDSVTLSLRHEDGNIQLMIQDNGDGFQVEEAMMPETNGDSIGLSSMKERCELSGGTFSIQSQRGEGTTVSADWVCD